MYTLIVVLHVIVSIALILIILLQTGKGSDIGAVFGGGSSQTLFGSTGPTSFLSKLTAGAAIIFMITSLVLAYFSGSAGSSSSIMKSGVPASTMPGPLKGSTGGPPAGMPAGMPAAPPAGVPAMPGAPAMPAVPPGK
ncbi:MAG TPA: preprotein translocase subunit SecG [Candidatus Methylomirabilis sp.]|nr:preprotein translocase subunit SecG [Candidatus Methylomirabilis sp.]